MKVTSTESFIEKAKTIHKNKYNYDKTVWVNSVIKVTITCPVHGEFIQRPNNHLTGYGCNKCGLEASSKKQSKPLSTFIKTANIVHNNIYDYSNTKYQTSKKKVEIICPTHGSFYITPSNHIHKTNPQGCPSCGKLKANTARKHTQKDIIRKFNSLNTSYDYSKVKYLSFHSKVEIVCKIHGSFWQTPAHHLGGTKCPACTKYGFDPEKPAILYYLSINNGEAYKIGITNRTVEARYKLSDISSITTIWYKEFDKGINAYQYEQAILKHFCDSRYTGPGLLANGNTELFNCNILPVVESLDQIQSVLEQL